MLDTPEGRGFYGAAGFNGNILVAQNHGFRAFRYCPDDKLRSLVFEYEWEPGINRAVCARDYTWGAGAHNCPFPSKNCSHGFYAYYDEDYYPTCDEDEGIVLSGVINGYGRCVIGDKGYRSEYANIVALIKPEPDDIPFKYLARWKASKDHAVALICARLEKTFPAVPIFDSAEELLKVIPLAGRPPRNDD